VEAEELLSGQILHLYSLREEVVVKVTIDPVDMVRRIIIRHHVAMIQVLGIVLLVVKFLMQAGMNWQLQP